ncbi:MAG: type VI secretion system-associated protein TagF [Proteobacteria bacterium]|nr:type VI secretion system-associated protein TagF [Pseudomonadota bacterium]
MSVAGWFGKIPALGDFATRRLPLSFVTPWDDWLSSELSQLRAQWEDQWPARFRRAPTLCFAIDAGVVDERAWQGVIVASHDRVGRDFPLTVAQSDTAAWNVAGWAGLVATAGRALEPGCGSADFDRLVEDFFAGCLPGSGTLPAQGLQRRGWWRWHDGEWAAAPSHVPTELPRGEHFRALLSEPPDA